MVWEDGAGARNSAVGTAPARWDMLSEPMQEKRRELIFLKNLYFRDFEVLRNVTKFRGIGGWGEDAPEQFAREVPQDLRHLVRPARLTVLRNKIVSVVTHILIWLCQSPCYEMLRNAPTC